MQSVAPSARVCCNDTTDFYTSVSSSHLDVFSGKVLDSHGGKAGDPVELLNDSLAVRKALLILMEREKILLAPLKLKLPLLNI